MKHFLILMVATFIGLKVLAQTPNAFKYQALVKDGSGTIVSNQSVGFRISILEGNDNGTVIYEESHLVTANDNGLVYFNIGEGDALTGDFSSIDWGSSSHYLQVEIDLNGGANYQLMGVSQLLSVPYALYAKSVENDAVDDADNDPVNELQDISLSGTELTIRDGSTIDLKSSFLWSLNNDDISFTTGKVGIGTNAPAYMLDVNGSLNASALMVNGVEIPTTWIWSNNGSDISYTNGNVGIGTSAPDSKMEIVGSGPTDLNTLHVKNNNYSAAVIVNGAGNVDYYNGSFISLRSRGTTDNPVNLISGDRIGGFFWRPYLSNDYQRTAAIHAYVGSGVSSTGYPTNIRFETTLIGSSVREEIMRISENGNVGIGATNPSYKLDVNGSINAAHFLVNGVELPSTWIWGTNGLDISYTSGFVGIGNTTPETKLDIRGNGELEPYPAQISNEGTNEFRLYSASNISYANSSVIFNRSRGGIGSESDLITGDRVGGIYWRPYLSDDFQRTAAIHAYIGDGVTSSSYPTNIRFETTLVGSSIREEIMRISEEGNVGIGTDAPKSKLQVKSGDVYIEDIGSGVIMKSPNGSCWRMTVDDSGNPVFSSITCPN